MDAANTHPPGPLPGTPPRRQPRQHQHQAERKRLDQVGRGPRVAARIRAVQGHAQRYGPKHRAKRKAWADRIARGGIYCWRPDCGRLITPDTAWDLGHDDDDPTVHIGPECASCNRGAAARKVNAMRRDDRGRYTSREW